tara:strand:+ start:376 stop:831 length:456 start_codon:yes stop_codon:yes gene_type:complete
MNQITQLYSYIKSLADADSYINTVTKKGADIIQQKGLIFPLLDVIITGASYTSPQTKQYTVEITCLALRDQTNETTTDNFWLMDNEVDNLNETDACLNRIWVNMFRNFQDNNITASENPSLTPILMDYTSLVDGWQMVFDVTVPNTTISLC